MDSELPTRLDCITALRDAARELGTSPTCKAYIRSGRHPCYVTIRRLLGYSWSACLEAADLAPAEWPPPAAEPAPEPTPEPTIPEPPEPPLAAVPLAEAVRAMLGQVRAAARAAESHSTKYRQQGQLAAQNRHVRAGLGRGR